jgi:hypothetical protein
MTDPIEVDLPVVVPGTTPEEAQVQVITDPDFLPVDGPVFVTLGGEYVSLLVEDPPSEGADLVASFRQEERDIQELQFLASDQALK